MKSKAKRINKKMINEAEKVENHCKVIDQVKDFRAFAHKVDKKLDILKEIIDMFGSEGKLEGVSRYPITSLKANGAYWKTTKHGIIISKAEVLRRSTDYVEGEMLLKLDLRESKRPKELMRLYNMDSPSKVVELLSHVIIVITSHEHHRLRSITRRLAEINHQGFDLEDEKMSSTFLRFCRIRGDN